MSSIDALPALDVATAMRYDANKKSPVVAYLLWSFFGSLGGHRFYAGRLASAIALLLLSFFSFLLILISVGAEYGFTMLPTLFSFRQIIVGGIGFLGFAIVGVWVLIDAFLIPNMIRSHNNGLIDLLTTKQAAI